MKVIDIFPELNRIKTNTKVHCAHGSKNRYDALLRFTEGTFKEWQEEQNNKNFERDYILSIIYYKENEWLFAGIYKRIDVNERDGKYYYNTELTDIRKDLIGRLIIHFKKEFRNTYLKLENHINSFCVCELLRKKYNFHPFPGYENVLIDYDTLKVIYKKKEPTWKSALCNIKGIYLITDKNNGKHYIGSAYGKEAFWQRWYKYIENGHGNNKKIKEVILKEGISYASNFIFSILEIRSMTVDDETIIDRECFWKKILMTIEYGYNEN
ncbi:MAG: GIY-YIG nuclease family protein [Bacteroidales bacterium]|nr:GIY-YIG nuclease family protein [Bacteroidales bacterium]